MRLAIPLFVLAVFSVGCQSGPRPAAEFVQQAQYLHDVTLSSTVLQDSDLDGYLNNDLGKRIIAAANAVNPNYTRDPVLANMKFHVVASDVVNAYGTGGGHIYIFNGLLQLCDTEEDLAALLTIQYAHALGLDIQHTGMQPIVNAGNDPLAVSRVVFGFVTSPFSATQCLEADQRAFEIYARGGWDPTRFTAIYERLKGMGYDFPPTIGGEGKPRPMLAARINAAAPLAQRLPTQAKRWLVEVAADPKSFRTEIKPRAQRLMANADLANRAQLYLAAFPNVVLPADLPAQQVAQARLRQDLTPPPVVGPKIEPN